MKTTGSDHFKQWINYEDVLRILTDKLGININGIDEISFEFKENIHEGKYLVITVKRTNEKNLTCWEIKSNTDFVACQHIYPYGTRKKQKKSEEVTIAEQELEIVKKKKKYYVDELEKLVEQILQD